MKLFQAFGQFAGQAAEKFDFELVASQSFSAVSSVSFDNVFTADYDHYMVLRNVQGSVANEQIIGRLRSGGSDDTSTLYASQLTGANSTTLIAQRGLYDRMQAALGYTETTTFGGAATYVLAPFLSNRTGFIYQHGYDNSASIRFYHWQGCFDAATSFDGITFYPSTGTITGSIFVYGLRI